MGFFKKLMASGQTTQPQVVSAALSSGRRLRSGLALDDCLSVLATVVQSCHPAKSVYRLPYVASGWLWNGAPGYEHPPMKVVTCSDTDDYPLFIAFWADQSGAFRTEMGLFPLGSGDERLSAMPIIGHWKQHDPSLNSAGVFPQGLIAVTLPPIPDNYVEEILSAAGCSLTPSNIDALSRDLAYMYLIKAWEFIKSKDARAADIFVDRHGYSGNPMEQQIRGVLTDLVAWNHQLLAYIQDLPMTIRAFVLEHKSGSDATWERLYS